MKWQLFFMVPALAVCSANVVAGKWGEENWGEMYWGSNTTSAPIVAPAFDTQISEDSFVVTINNFIAGTGQDGWSVITNYIVGCEGADPVNATTSSVIVSGLDSDTEYSCTVTATNKFGQSPVASFTARTETTAGGLPIWLLYEATKPRAN